MGMREARTSKGQRSILKTTRSRLSASLLGNRRKKTCVTLPPNKLRGCLLVRVGHSSTLTQHITRPGRPQQLDTIKRSASFSFSSSQHPTFLYSTYSGFTALSSFLTLHSSRSFLTLSRAEGGEILPIMASRRASILQPLEEDHFSITSTKKKTGYCYCCHAASPRSWPAWEKPPHRRSPQSSRHPTVPCPSKQYLPVSPSFCYQQRTTS